MFDAIKTLSTTHKLAVVGAIVVMVAGGGAFAAATGTFDSLLSDDEGPMMLDSVPNESTTVVYAERGIVDDPTTEAIGNHVLNKTSFKEDAPTFEERRNNLSEETGLDWKEFESITFFMDTGTYTESRSRYLGAIVQTSWDEENFTSQAAEAHDGTLNKSTYKGYTLYEVEAEYGESDYIGVISDGTYVVGSEPAVKDSLDTTAGDQDALSGTVRDHLEATQDGYVVFATTVPNSTAEMTDKKYADDVTVLSGSYYTNNDDRIGLRVSAEMENGDAADLLKEQAEGGLATLEQQTDNETVVGHIDNVQVSQEQTKVSVTYESNVTEVNQLIDWYFEGGNFESDDSRERQQNAVAGVSIDEEPDYSGEGDANVTVTAVSMDQADKVIVDFAGERTTITSVGGSVSHDSMSSGDRVIIVAEYNGQKNVIQTYTVQG